MKKYIPWYLKIILKIIISRLSINRRFLHKIGIFKHGSMDTVEYSKTVFQRHFNNFKITANDCKVLEIGPGNSIVTGLYAHASGCSKTYLVDDGDYITRDMRFYHEVIKSLDADDLIIQKLLRITHFTELLGKIGIEYLTRGLESLKTIESNSIDFIFSNAVLEHIKKSEFVATVEQMYRILKCNGFSSHEIDLKDHLCYSLNNLRFPERIWESRLFQTSGFYTNRIRYEEMLNIFKSVGFKVEVIRKWNWDEVPIKKKSFSAPFNDLSDDDLKVYCFDVILRKDNCR